VTIYDDLLLDTIDLHCHVDVEFSTSVFRKREPEWEWLPKAEAAGMSGVVLKSHLWPTTTLVSTLDQLYGGPVAAYSSVTLNGACGGVDVFMVEAAAQLGARMVFMPTWSTRNDRERGGFHQRLDQTFSRFDPARLCQLTVVNDDGMLLAAARDVVRYCQEAGLALGTGHLSWQESLTLAREARAIGLDRLVFSHPYSQSVGAPVDAMREAAELGALIELCWTNIAPGRHDPRQVAQVVQDIGAEHFVLASDYFTGGCPAPPDLFRMLLASFYDAGLSAGEIRTMAVQNPRRALGL
jgi:hypothetical protein